MHLVQQINAFLDRIRVPEDSNAGAVAISRMFELEQRVLYDASPLGALLTTPELAVADIDGADDDFDLDQELLAYAEEAIAEPDSVLTVTLEQNVADDASLATDAPTIEPARQLIVIDAGVEDYQDLVRSLDPTTRVLVLQNDRSGVSQISDALRSSGQTFDAVHIVSHGRDGGVQLGSEWLDQDSLPAVANQLSQWTHWLSSDADVLFYGCNLAGSEAGEEFVDSISALTGADVAASDDLTGHSDLGGDWDFEYVVGTVDSNIVFTEALRDSWFQVLATITVDTTIDENNGDTSSITNLIGSSGGTGISLREAIIAANSTAGADSIILGAGTYTLSIAGTGENSSATGDLDIQTEITILGAGINSTIIDANGLDRVIEINGSGYLTLMDVTLTGGSVDNDGGGLLIENATGTASLTRVEVTGNQVTGGFRYGGGIHNAGGTLILDSSLVHDNTASGSEGGGISNTGNATIGQSSIYNNSAEYGGGISQFSGMMTIVNTTISGNLATLAGGGIDLLGGSSITVEHSTIADNTASSGNGGGLSVLGGTATISSSIFADNNSTSGGNDLHGIVTSGGDNIIEHNSGFSGTVGSDILGSDPGLAALALDSGTYVHAITSASIAYNSANGSTETDDQRGITRDANPDIGAYEFSGSAPTNLFVSTSNGGGLQLNDDGGNDAYLLADDGDAILGGLSSLTFEVEFSSTDALTTQPLVSYATASTANSFFFLINAAGNATFMVDTLTPQVVSSAMDYRTLADGNRQALAVTWDSAAGDWQILVNGVLIDSGTGYAVGKTVPTDPSGTLLFGQEQDAVEGGFSTADVFSGTLYRARFFDDVRTAGEIAVSYSQELAHDEAGLLAQWNFDNLSSNGVITESVSGNNLTVKHYSGTGFTTSTPELTFSLSDAATTGTIVGTVTGVDAERDALIASLLASDPDLVYSADTGKFYKAVDSVTTWGAAQTAAVSTTLNSVNGQLVTIRSATENELVNQIRGTHLGSNSIWLGGGDFNTEGNWQWYDGATASDTFWSGDQLGTNVDGAYTNWLSTDPNDNGPGEDAAQLYSDGEWRDLRDDSNARYLIEWNADGVLDATQSLTYSIQSQTVAGAFAIDANTGQITVTDPSLLNFEVTTTALTIRVTDADGNTYDEGITVELDGSGGQPTQTVPGTQSVNEDGTLTFNAGNGNQVLVGDTGPEDSLLQVSLSVNDGTLTLFQSTGLTFLQGSISDASIVIQGTESDINAALEGMTFDPDGNFNGAVTLNMTTSLGADLEGHYTFDDMTADDSSFGTTQDGTFTGNATTTNDPTRVDVLSLDGSGDYVEISSLFSDPTDVTLAAWVNFSSTDTFGAEVLSLGNNVILRVDDVAEGTVGIFYDGTSYQKISSNISLADGQWHHVAFSIDDTANIQTLYIDGAVVATGTYTSSIDYTTAFSTTRIGAHANNADPNFDFNGLIDDARVYTRSLSASEIAGLATDQTTTSDAVAITVNAVNDAPVMTGTNASFATITEDNVANTGRTVAGLLLTVGADVITDADGLSEPEGIAVFVNNEGTGSWQYQLDGTSTWVDFGTVGGSSALLLRSIDSVRFLPNGVEGSPANFGFRAWDQSSGTAGTYADASSTGGSTAFSTITKSALIAVTDVNDAPTITNGYTHTLTTTNEDTTSSGTLASAILTGSTWADVDPSAVSGLALTGKTGNGTWQYSTDGTTWTSFGTVSSTNALLITSTTQVRYIPDNNNGETGTFSYKAWDQTTGTASTNGAASYATTASSGGTTAYSTNNATAQIVISSVNDAPVLTTTGSPQLSNVLQNSLDPLGNLVSAVIASAGGNPINDVDSGAVEGIVVTFVDNTNGTWQYSTNGGSSWNTFGTPSDVASVVLTDTANDRIRFVPTTGYTGDASFNYRGWDATDSNPSGTTGVNTTPNGATTAYSTATETATIYVEPAEVKLWLSTSGDVGPSYSNPSSGVPGLDSWSEGEIIGIGDPNLSFGAGTTDGSFQSIFDFDTFAADFDVDIIGLHFVTANITVTGPAITSGGVSLLAGDVIFITDAAETLSNAAVGAPAGWANNIVTAAGDVFVFRAENPDNYGSGYFIKLMNDPAPTQTISISLVEHATTIDGTVLAAGDFLYVQSGDTLKSDIVWYDTGANNSTTLIEGTDIGFTSGAAGAAITGIEFVESGTTIGGVTVNTGNILITTDKPAVAGGLPVQSQDVFALNVTATTLGSGTAAATATMLLDGNGNLDSVEENIDALTLIIEGSGTNQAPAIGNFGAAANFVENGTPTVIDGTITVVDADSADFAGGILSINIAAGGAIGDRLSIFNQGTGVGQIGISGNNVTYNFGSGAIVVGTFSGGLNSGSPLVVNLNANANAASTQALMRNVSFWNSSSNPATAARTIQFVLSDGDGGTSNVISQAASVTAVADSPIAVDDRSGLNFDGVDDYVAIADSASLRMTNTVTMEAWINPDASANVNRMIINKEGEYEVALFSDNRIYWAFANTDPGWAWHDTGYTVSNGQWTHIAVAYDNGTVTTYVNGDIADVYAGSGSIGDAYGLLNETRIGGRSNAPDGKYFDGRIDEVRIWNDVRTQAEIQSNLDVNLVGNETGLAGYWNFNEGIGTTATDLANGNNGTLTDGAATGTPVWTGYTTDQNSPINISAANGIVSNDVDGDGDALTVTLVNGNGANVGTLFTLPSGANLTVDSLGAITYDPNGAYDYLATGQTAVDSFSYQIDDGNGNTGTATVYITISGFNDAPQTTNLNAAEAYTEDIALNLTDIVISDNDDANVTVILTLSDVGAGSLNTGTSGTVTSTFAGGVWTASGAKADVNALLASVTFTPTGDYAGNFTIATSVDDGEAAPVTGVKNITATPINDAPILAAGVVSNLTVNEDSGFTTLGLSGITYGPGGGTDENSQSLTIQVTVIPSPTFGSVYLADGITVVSTGTYTLTQLQGLQFRTANDAAGGPSFFSWNVVDDGGTANGGANTLGQAIQLNIAGINDEQVLNTNLGTTVLEGSTGNVVTTAMLQTTDVDNTTAQLFYTVTSVPSNGILQRSGSNLSVSSTFTQADIDAGIITYLHNDSETTADSFSFTVDDETGSISSGTFNIAVTPVNETPTDITPDSFNVNENVDTTAGYSVGTLTSSDPDSGDTFTYSVVGGADQSKFTISGNQLVLTDGVLNFENQSSYSVTVRTTDSGGLWYEETLTINVNDLNETPTDIAPNSFSIDENIDTTAGVSVGTLTSTDVDGGESFTYTVVGGTDQARFAISGDQLLLTDGFLDFETQSSYSVSVRTTDSGGLWYEKTLTVNVNDLNETPTDIAPNSFSASENTDTTGGYSVGTLTTADPDSGETFTYTVVGGIDQSKFSISSNQLVLTDGVLDYDAKPSYSVTIRTTDSGGLWYEETLTVTVTGQNETPTDIGPNSFSINENIDTTAGVSVGTLMSADVDRGETFTYTIVGGTDQTNFTTSGNQLVLTDGILNFETKSSYSVAVRTTDSGGLFYEETLTINVVDLNEAPVMPADTSVSVVENTTLVGTFAGSDQDAADTLTYSLSGTDAAVFNINSATGEVSFITAPDFETPGDFDNDGVYDITVVATDDGAGSLSDGQNVTITVADANEAPVLPADTAVNVAENTTTVGTFAATDVDGDTLTYSLTGTDAALFNIDGSTGEVTFIAAPNFEVPGDAGGNNVYDITVVATDNGTGNLTDSQNVAVSVGDVNETPTMPADTAVNVAENTLTVGTFTGADPDSGDSLVYTLAGADASLFDINALSGEVTFRNPPDFETPLDADGDNTYEITVVGSDGALSDSQNVSVTVTDGNEAPLMSPTASVNFAENSIGTVATITGTDTDPGDSLTYSISGADAALFNFDGNTGEVTFINAPDFEAPNDVGGDNVHNVTVTATDQGGLTADTSLQISVTDQNETPIMPADTSVNVVENTVGVGTFAGADPDSGDSLVYSVAGPDAAQFDINALTGEVTFRNAPNFEIPSDVNGDGVYDVVVQVTDGTLSDSQNVTINVTDINEAPELNNNPISVELGEEVVIDASVIGASDVEQAPTEIMFIVTQTAAYGEVLLSGVPTTVGQTFTQEDVNLGRLTYQNNGEVVFVDSFMVDISDGNGGLLTSQQVNLDINVGSSVGGVTGGGGGDGSGNDTDDSGSTNDVGGMGGDSGENQDNSSQNDDQTGEDPEDTTPILLSPAIGSAETTEQLVVRTEAQNQLSDQELAEAEILQDITDPELANLILQGIAIERVAGPNGGRESDLDFRGYDARSFTSDVFGLWQELEKYSQASDVSFDVRMSVGAITVLGTFGGILWALRGGALMAVAFANLPGWNFIDPLPILEGYTRRKQASTEEDLASFF